jgi:hypothetical protein
MSGVALEKQTELLFSCTVYGETGISPGEQSCKFSIAMSSQYFSMVVKLGKLQSK